MYEIIPGKLYQRGEFLKFSLEEKIAELDSKNITMIANLIGRRDDELAFREPYFYWHFPIPDGKLTDSVKATLLEYSEIFTKQLKTTEKAALVHCHAGRNRSALFSALIAVQYLGISGKESIEYLREKRPNALANENFVKWLENLHELTRK